MYPPPARHHTLYGDMGFFILIISCLLGITGSSRCIYQMRTRTVQSGGSVTIPCSYSGPEELGADTQISWSETDEALCLSTDKKIFSPSGNVIEKYKGRLYREKDPNRNRTEYITITGLEPTDGPRFCCHIYNSKNNIVIPWNRHGTLLQFPEYVTQLDELMAISNKEAILPCYHSKGTSSITSVSWYLADREYNTCTEHLILESFRTQENSLYSLVSFPQDISILIHNVHLNDYRSYCCVVSTAEETLRSKQFTRLIVADYQPSWDDPTKEISVQEGRSVILNCSYTPPSGQYTERHIVRVNVYWRVGNVSGPYAYHPYQEMVHSTYIHRTSITGTTNLMIKNVMMTDNTSFHCFVVIKLCIGGSNFDEKIQYGGGTRLIINDRDASSQDPGTDNNLSSRDNTTIIIICSVIVLIILIVVLVVLKVKGVICKKKKHSSDQQLYDVQAPGDVTSEETPYCEISTKNAEDIPVAGTDEAEMKIEGGQTGDGEDGTLLYAQLNQTKLKEKRPAEQPMQNEDVIYSAVVNPASK